MATRRNTFSDSIFSDPNSPYNKPPYNAADWDETDLVKEFSQQMEDAKSYFLSQIKPRLDRSYKLYIAYNGDRAKEIQKWQMNVFVPYVQSVVETLLPRILDARPDFDVQGRTEAEDAKAQKQKYLTDYFWERAGMDKTTEDFVRACLIYGTSFLQVYWKKDVREMEFLQGSDMNQKPKWKTEERTFYDAPYADWVDNYGLWYDWRNVEFPLKRYWFRRLILTKQEIIRRYPLADPRKIEMIRPGGDLWDYGQIRRDVKTVHDSITRGREIIAGQAVGYSTNFRGMPFDFNTEKELYEVFEWWRPFTDRYSVMVNNVPILYGGEIPNPYDFKESPFIGLKYLQIPGESEGYGLPIILENPQILLNTIKNQRMDAVTLNIHKMWIVNPLANIDKKELITRPFGIVYSTDPNGVKAVEFADVKQSAYQEEQLLKNDMRYASGVDDFSMGSGGESSSATEVRHLRESTIERVRLFINHLGESFATLQRYWIAMQRQFFTERMTIRIIGQDGQTEWPIIEKDDLMGYFTYKATVLPSIAGMNEVKKKQDMDLLQLLMPLQFVDQQKLVQKVLYDWRWNFNSIAKSPDQMQQEQAAMGQGRGAPGESINFKDLPPEGQIQMAQQAGIQLQPPQQALPAQGAPMQGQPMQGQPMPVGGMGGPRTKVQINPAVIRAALALLGSQPPQTGILGPNLYAEASSPIPQVQGAMPPTVGEIPSRQSAKNPSGATQRPYPKQATTNPRGLSRGGKVNTNLAQRETTSEADRIMSHSNSIQR
jgi:hypothetical protein